MSKKNYDDIALLATGSAVDSKTKTSTKQVKSKLIPLPLEWDEILSKQHHGTKSSYILAAIKEKMIRDGYL
jgi:hypothetical protein